MRDLTHTVKVTAVLFSLIQYLEYVVPFAVEYHDALVEVVVLHGAGRVQNGERRLSLRLKGVVGTSMVKVVTQTGHKQP